MIRYILGALLLHSAFTNLVPGWLKTFNHFRFSFVLFLLRSASTRLVRGRLEKINYLRFLFLLGSCSLSTLMNFSTLMSLVHLNFSQLLDPGPSDLHRTNAQTVWCLVSPLFYYLCSLWLCVLGLKSSIGIYFRTPTHASFRHPTCTIHGAFALSFIYLKSTKLHCLSKVNM